MACVANSIPLPQFQTTDQLRKGQYTISKELGTRPRVAGLRRPIATRRGRETPGRNDERVNLRALKLQVTSLVHECNAMSRVQHPNVLQIERLVSGTTRGCDYVAMVTEFAPNGDLFNLLEVGGALSEPLVKVYACPLEACHAKGVVHRDVKLENLLLDGSYQLKLADFGVAALVLLGDDATGVFSRDESGTAISTAPEIHSNVLYRGTPVDVWSAGVVLFILLTGLPPFNEANRGDAWYDDLLNGDLEHFWKTQPVEVMRTMTPGAQELISAMLVEPDQRITVTEALQHPWLRGADCVDTALIRDAVSTHLEAARAASKM